MHSLRPETYPVLGWRQPVGNWENDSACSAAISIAIQEDVIDWPDHDWKDARNNTLWHYWAASGALQKYIPSLLEKYSSCFNELSNYDLHACHILVCKRSLHGLHTLRDVAEEIGKHQPGSMGGTSVGPVAKSASNTSRRLAGTPLYYAVLSGCEEMASLCAQINKYWLVEEDVEEFPLLSAAVGLSYSLLHRLLEWGVDPNISDPMGKTALHYAMAMQDYDAASCIEEYGGDVDKKDAAGLAPKDMGATGNEKAARKYRSAMLLYKANQLGRVKMLF